MLRFATVSRSLIGQGLSICMDVNVLAANYIVKCVLVLAKVTSVAISEIIRDICLEILSANFHPSRAVSRYSPSTYVGET